MFGYGECDRNMGSKKVTEKNFQEVKGRITKRYEERRNYFFVW